MPVGEAAPTLVPCDLGVGLSGHHTIQVQGLPLSHVGGGGLDVDGLGQSRGCGYNGQVRKARLPGVKAGSSGGGSECHLLSLEVQWLESDVAECH